MGILEQAAADLRTILEDPEGFSCQITVTDPNSVTVVLQGFRQDISQSIDPATGIMVAGRKATVALPLAALEEAGLEVPRGIQESTSMPWVVAFADAMGVSRTFKVALGIPDYGAGIIVCELEAFET